MKKSKLYFCDGLACDNLARDCCNSCYLSGGDCYHTSDKKHSLTDKLKDIYKTQDANFYLPTCFVYFPGSDVLVEKIDEKSFLFDWRSANKLLIENRDMKNER